jgi:hypothetical protein
MPDQFICADGVVLPVGDPTCCPDAYLCLSGAEPEIECPRHGGFDVCCGRPDQHVPQDPGIWHEQMTRWEQNLLNTHIQRFKIFRTYDLEDTPYADSVLRNHI